jgi:hypothetical protein
LEIDIKELLGSVPALRALDTRIGWPEDPTVVRVADPQRFAASFDAALRAFHEFRRGASTLLDVDINSYHKSVWVRFVQHCARRESNGEMEAALRPAFRALRAVAVKNGGNLHYWGGNKYFDVLLPYRGPIREEFPDVEHLPWDEHYRCLLDRAAWRSLREMVFRFSKLAESVAARCSDFQMSSVLIPSVGLCIHPWLFANCGLSVAATDSSGTALAALSEPARWPRMFSRVAYDRWNISKCASHASIPHPDYFTKMPVFEDQRVREELHQRITFARADWASLPLKSGSVDVLFATNAIPRESPRERIGVIREWVRVVRPGGVAFIAQHNPPDWHLGTFFQDHGWVETDVLGGERPIQTNTTGFQIRYSTG